MAKKKLDSAAIDEAAGTVDVITEARRQEALLKAGALQNRCRNDAAP